MFTIVETSIFIKYAKQVWGDDERIAFINWIAANPLAGDVIPHSGGCRKVRCHAAAWASVVVRVSFILIKLRQVKLVY